jgi:hypothetical protein
MRAPGARPVSSMPEPAPADFTADLAALEQRQALLHAALAAFQAGIPQLQPLGAYGLALYHRLAVVNNAHSIEAVLVHSAGGEIASGFLPIDGNTVSALQRVTADLLISAPIRSLPVEFSTPQQAQSPIPSAAAEAEPEPEPQADEPPTAEELAAIKDDLDRIFNRRPGRVKELTGEFRTCYEVPARTPVPKALTTRERVQWLRKRIDVILDEIAYFDENVKTAVAESSAQRASGSRGFTALDP